MKALRTFLPALATVAAATAMAATLVVSGGPAYAATQGPYEIHPYGYPYCVTGTGTAQGSAVTISQCSASSAAASNWDFTDTSDHYYRISNRESHRCMNVQGNVTYPQARIQQYSCGTRSTVLNDQWRPEFVARLGGRDYYRLVSRRSNLCLRLSSSAPGSQLIQEECYDVLNRHLWTWYRPPGA
jgi:hypothetical protein